ncbi:enterochelin esterase-like enzyme [Psychromicrobium silvestre]|uniref:Enterochelin esterase-like enzyme n=1 Tax=Psychromicrobium silvestre TaxID=1645614 RepID=A0A7Y9LRI7_9MICC|nr:alpha/beta hydrolase-fold protein [Psychromicrobium silvestre]NYE94275.1 enterochelin esterase-like enzyme [Psychromicrobium silvestre]
MPAVGKTGVVYIDPKASGFKARPAGVYLPPAALTAHPPKLPFYLLMMGQPGRPDPHYVEGIFNDYAKKHRGLAPIVLVADQVGPTQSDTLCLNSAKFGQVEDYIAKDVVSWAKQNLNILSERKYWTVAGYSNGGQCAISFAAKYPQVWGNVVDISGEEYPGAEHPASNLSSIFNGDQAAYDAEKPINIMAKHHYPDTHAVFTVGSDDSLYVAQAKRVSQAAREAGMIVDYHEVLNGGHLIKALAGGLTRGLQVLDKRWGLSQ